MATRRGGRVKKNKAFRRHKNNFDAQRKQIEKNLKFVLNEVLDNVEAAGEDVGSEIEALSNEFAPKDTGELVQSSFSEAYREKKDLVIISIGYRADHSIYTHEIGPYANPTTPGTDWKYLERAVEQEQDNILPRIRQRARLRQ